MKKAEDSDAWIVQWYETRGEKFRSGFVVAPNSKESRDVKLPGRRWTPVGFDGKTVRVQTKKEFYGNFENRILTGGRINRFEIGFLSRQMISSAPISQR